MEIFFVVKFFFQFFFCQKSKKDLGIRFRRFWEDLFFKCRKIVDFFFCRNFTFHGWGKGFASPPGLCLWTPHAIGLRTLVGTGKRSTAFQQKSLPFYFQDFFLSQNRLIRMLKFLFRILTKKKMWKKKYFRRNISNFFSKKIV